MRILLAEDDVFHRDILERTLLGTDESIELSAVTTGAEFLAQIATGKYDIGLLDYHLPDQDGADILLRLDRLADRPPVIVISSDGQSDTVIACLRSGGRDFLPKSDAFDPGKLFQRIHEVLRRVQAEQHLIEQQKDESLAVLAGGVAHDFNNILVGVLSKATLIDELGQVDDRSRQWARGIASAAHRLADLARQLLAYARGGKYQPRSLDVVETITDTLQMLHGSIRGNVRIATHFDPESWLVCADRAQLTQMLLNLCLNACEAMPRGGALSVSTINVTKREPWQCLLHHQQAPGDYLLIRVADTGAGIPEDTRRRMFEPFYSTKGDSRGLGLSAVKGIVRNHGGGLLVHTQPGIGTIFEIFLPRNEAEIDCTEVGTGQCDLREKRLLVIDDEADVREVIEDILVSRGAEVLAVGTANEGILVCQREADRLDGLVVDMRLPDQSGADVIRECRALAPDLPIVVCSGYERDSALHEVTVGQNNVAFLPKPFTLSALEQAVAEVLQRPTTHLSGNRTDLAADTLP